MSTVAVESSCCLVASLPRCLVASLPFVHQGIALAAVCAALIPLIVHLINRRRHQRVRWAAMGFLLAANTRSLRRVRLEQLALLLVRTAVIVLLGLAVARPILSDAAFTRLGQASWHRVLLIDNSLSASVPGEGGADAPAGTPAVEAALKLLDTFPAHDAVSAVTLAAPADAVIGHAAFDRRMVRKRIAAIAATHRSTDLAGGFAAALEVLEDSPAAPQNRAVYVISDQAAAAWRDGEEAAGKARRLADEVTLVVIPTATGRRDNLAVTALDCAESLPGTHQPVRLNATVSNFGRTAARGATLQVRRAGRIVRRIPLDLLEPGEHRQVTFSVLPRASGTHGLEVRLEARAADVLPVDDVRRLSLDVFESVPVLLVDGRPGADRFSGETGYLATAMAPQVQVGRASLLHPKTVTELELPGEVLEAYRVIALCNVQRLEQEMWRRLRAFVEAGGGLLIFVGDAVSPDNYNRFAYADGHRLLPARLGQPIGEASNRDTFMRLQLEPFTHPAMTDFAEAEQSSLFLKGRVYRLMPVEQDPAGATVLLRYSNGLPAIVERSSGRGRVCLVTTTANMAWNNLAARGDYVSLIWSLTSYLAGGTTVSRNLLAGDQIVERLSAAQASQPLRVTVPGGRADDARFDVVEGQYRLRYGPVESAGSYTVAVGTTQLHYAVNVDPRESDLQVMDESALGDLIKAPFTYLADLERVERGGVGGGSAEMAQLLQYLVLLLLVGETWLAMRFARRRW